MKKIFIFSIIVLIGIITCVFIFTTINTSSNNSPWVCLDDTESYDRFLGFVQGIPRSDSGFSTLFRGVNRIYVYDGFDRKKLLDTILFPGEFIDYSLNYTDDLKLIVKTDDKLRLLEYSIGVNDISFVRLNDVECERFMDDCSFSLGSITIQSVDKRRIQQPDDSADYKQMYTFDKPVVDRVQDLINSNAENLVFDGKRIFDPFKSEVDVLTLDYTGFEKEHAKLDFSKKVIIGPNYFYNNNLLVLLDPKTHKITSIKTLKDVLNIYHVSNDVDESNLFFKYLTKDGLYLYDGIKSVKLKEFTNMIELNECKPTFACYKLYAIYDGSSSRIFDFDTDYDLENSKNKRFFF